VVAYDEEADKQATKPILQVGSLLSRQKSRPVLSVLNHDDDVLRYWRLARGELSDSCNSNPDAVEEDDGAPPCQTGDAEKLCTAIGPGAGMAAVETALGGDHVFAVDRHRELADALSLPSWTVGFGYGYVADGELENEIDLSQLIQVGDRAAQPCDEFSLQPVVPDRQVGKRDDQGELIDRLIQGLVPQERQTAALGEAARSGRIDLIEDLLASGLGVDDWDEDGNTPLLMAASGGQSHVVAYLIERGADVNAVSERRGMTSLMAWVAALHPKQVYLKTLVLLLRAGAARTLGIRDAEGRTASDWGRNGRPREIIALLEAQRND
jgi:hypothetical protein